MDDLKYKFSRFFLIDVKEPFYSEKSRKIFLISSFSYIGLASLLVFIGIGLFQRDYYYSLILTGFAILTLTFLIFIKFNRDKYRGASLILSFIMFLLAIALLVLFDKPDYGVLWQYVFLPMAFFLMGKRKALIPVALLLLFTLAFYFYHPSGSQLEVGFMFRYVFTYLIVLFFVFLFEFVRERTLISLNHSKDRISELYAESVQQNEEIKTQNEEIRAQSEQIASANNKLEKLSLVAQHTDNAVIILDVNGDFEWVNEGFEKLFGIKLNQIPGNKRNIKQLSSSENIEEVLENCKKYRKSISYESVQTHANGHLVTLNSTITPIFDNNGEIKNYVIIDSDISLIKHTQNKLEELNKNLEKRIEDELAKNREKDALLMQQSRQAAMGEMISNIAHQWRQPLNAIGIIVQNFSEAYQYGDINQKYLDLKIAKIMSIISYMSETIDDFRNFFKPEKKAQKFFVKDAVEKAINFVEANFKGLNIDVKFVCKGNPVAFGYPNEYMQVVINILNNARDVLVDKKNEEPFVKIELSSNNGGSILKIFNNGKKIDDNVKEKIFDPYFSTKDISRGTGLGLYMGKNIIENSMSGNLYFENKPDGVEFIIDLPESSQ
ncbi:MAG: PAS domain-containing sensor histidine kinase [Bacteroidales bacterium]